MTSKTYRKTKELINVTITRKGKEYKLGKPGTIGFFFKYWSFKIRSKLNLI